MRPTAFSNARRRARAARVDAAADALASGDLGRLRTSDERVSTVALLYRSYAAAQHWLAQRWLAQP